MDTLKENTMINTQVKIQASSKDKGYTAKVKYVVDNGRGYVVETKDRGEFFILSEGLTITKV